jgi:hypothetical protein
MFIKVKKGNFQGILYNYLEPKLEPEEKLSRSQSRKFGFAAPWSRSRRK